MTEYTVDLGGVPATDSGTDSGGAFCGNGVAEAPEECDGADFEASDCLSLGFSGGTLDCGPLCTFDVSGCAGPPTVPTPRRPMNASYAGSVHVPGSLRPVFGWEPSLVGGGATLTYELQYGTDPAFGPSVVTVMTEFTSHQPSADVAASLTPPVGARYYWRVRACAGASCSAYSVPWYVNIGRSDRDFNGDGYADVSVGAPYIDAVGLNSGSAYVFFGSPGASFEPTADLVLPGPSTNDHMGQSVAAVGDVNGDGFAELLVGAETDGTGGSNAGTAYLFLGGAGAAFDTTADLAFIGAPGANLGTTVAAGGDLNGDGFADLLIGAPHAADGPPDAGAVFVFFGGMLADTTPDGVLVGEASMDLLGLGAAGAGDLNGDGFADVVVGAPGSDAAGTDAGRGYVFLGGAGVAFEAMPDGIMNGAGSGDELGAAVASAGDVNGDGFADLVIGARLNGAGDIGQAYVFLGGSAMDFVADGTLTGSSGGDWFGSSVAPAGDVDGDGFADILVGADKSSAGGMNAGRAYVFRGEPGSTFNATSDATLTGIALDRFGAAVAAGDVNGDGVPDLVIGASASGAAIVNAGAVFVFMGGWPLDTGADGTMTGSASGDAFGSAVQ